MAEPTTETIEESQRKVSEGPSEDARAILLPVLDKKIQCYKLKEQKSRLITT